MHWIIFTIIFAIIFFIGIGVIDNNFNWGFPIIIVGLVFAIVGICAGFKLDDQVRFEGRYEIVPDKYGGKDRCFITHQGMAYDLHSSWCGLDSVYVYSSNSERWFGFIKNDEDGKLILRETKDPKFDSVLERKEN